MQLLANLAGTKVFLIFPADAKEFFLSNDDLNYAAVRQSAHIMQDLRRNWSSWSYGALGFEGTWEELVNELLNTGSVSVSGFEICSDEEFEDWDEAEKWLENKSGYDIRQLRPDYWVAVDTDGEGICVWEMDDIDDALAVDPANTAFYTTEGRLDRDSCGEIYIVSDEAPVAGEYKNHILLY
jgi:hypothetical protein